MKNLLKSLLIVVLVLISAGAGFYIYSNHKDLELKKEELKLEKMKSAKKEENKVDKKKNEKKENSNKEEVTEEVSQSQEQQTVEQQTVQEPQYDSNTQTQDESNQVNEQSTTEEDPNKIIDNKDGSPGWTRAEMEAEKAKHDAYIEKLARGEIEEPGSRINSSDDENYDDE